MLKCGATDISQEALEVAEENARLNNTGIRFFKDDLLNPQQTYPKFDIIVSNPPYVSKQDKSKMHLHVLDYEPHIALFPPRKKCTHFL